MTMNLHQKVAIISCLITLNAYTSWAEDVVFDGRNKVNILPGSAAIDTQKIPTEISSPGDNVLQIMRGSFSARGKNESLYVIFSNQQYRIVIYDNQSGKVISQNQIDGFGVSSAVDVDGDGSQDLAVLSGYSHQTESSLALKIISVSGGSFKIIKDLGAVQTNYACNPEEVRDGAFDLTSRITASNALAGTPTFTKEFFAATCPHEDNIGASSYRSIPSGAVVSSPTSISPKRATATR